jgi:acylphosphatase
MTTARRVLVEGRVQGVGFRAFVRATGADLGLAGWVRNLSDGRVEAFVEGEDAAVAAFLERCRKGPPFGRVERLEAEDAAPEGYSRFEVLRTPG